MYLIRGSILVLVFIAFSGCATRTTPTLPLSETPWPAPDLTLVWAGVGETYRFEEGTWQRAPSFDYDFEVVQRRYRTHWESSKTMRRRHPEYDGSAGPRAQNHHFTVRYGERRGNQIAFDVASTLGDGSGEASSRFETARMEFPARGAGGFWPFNTYRITQTYNYTDGTLEETVELFKRDDGEETPWVRVEERAVLFAPSSFEAPPGPLPED